MEKARGRGIYHCKNLFVCDVFPRIPLHFDRRAWKDILPLLKDMLSYEITIVSNKPSVLSERIKSFLVDEIKVNPSEDDEPFDDVVEGKYQYRYHAKQVGDYNVFYRTRWNEDNNEAKLDDHFVKVRHIDL
jgi:hypothetical protein